MVQIDIVGNENGDLILEVDGNPNNGRSSAKRGEDVHWKVKEQSGVGYIYAITMKGKSGNADIFSSDPPREQNAQKKHWKGTVNHDAEDHAEYAYNIEWVDVKNNRNTFDPVISIRPS